MNGTRSPSSNAVLLKQGSALLKSLNGSGSTSMTAIRPGFIGLHHPQAQLPNSSSRHFSTSKPTSMKPVFPEPDSPGIRTTKAAWAHPVYTREQMESVIVAHRNAKNWSDWVALSMMRMLRWGLDLGTGYKKDPKVPKLKEGKPVTLMTERKWLIRFVFLESVAGVPGMVAGMLRHLRSMRRLQRDNGWIETLLEESYNERMHLLTFLQLTSPGPLMRLMVLGAQGVFFNTMFLSYLLSPRTCHRFVGYLEEEAVVTYTRVIDDIDAGKLPTFAAMQAPDIAVKYWDMPENARTMRDLLQYVRADESKHREVNHTLGSLNQEGDPNPYVSEYKDEGKPHPTKDLRHQKPTGWEREEVI